MKLGKMDKVELSGLTVLFIGVIFLAFTFFSAYTFLAGKLDILTQDILQAFGEALGPLIEAVIRILYLGIMGWIGSILTIRGVQLLKKERTEATPPPQQQSVQTENKQATKQEPKPEAKETKNEAEKPTQVKEAEKTQTPETPKQAEKPEETIASSSSTPTQTPS